MATSNASNAAVRRAVEEAVETEIQARDVNQRLSYEQYDEILKAVADELFYDRLLEEMRPTLNSSDNEYLQSQVAKMVSECLEKPVKLRFGRFDRVVCKIGGERGWGAGTIQALNEEDPSDPTGMTKLPYVVKLDPPLGRLISVPYDEYAICRAEICFGLLSPNDLGFSLRCKPSRLPKQRRFKLGDRVACAVEDEDADYTTWAPGTITDVDYDARQCAEELGLEWDWESGSGVLPYRVRLDDPTPCSTHVFVHRDVHWLLRDLALQPAGPRLSSDGTRNLTRMVKRRLDETQVELIDHETCRRRVQTSADSSSDEETDSAPA